MVKSAYEILASQQGCITFKASNENDIEIINAYLNHQNFSDIPPEYVEFLYLSDGLIFNGIELFGTESHQRSEKNYTFPSLKDVNAKYIPYDFFTRKLVLGRISEAIILFDKKNGVYAIVDRINLRSRIETASFCEILKILATYC